MRCLRRGVATAGVSPRPLTARARAADPLVRRRHNRLEKVRRRKLMNIAQRLSIDPQVKNYISMPRKLLIGGQWVEAKSGKSFPVYDPSTGTVLAQVAEADAADVDDAVRAARRAFDEGPWSRMTPSERGRALWRLSDLIELHA